MNKITLLFILIFLHSCTFTGQALCKPVAQDFQLIVLHTNDIHGHDLPFEDKGHSVGGLARLANLVFSIRRNKDNVVVIDAGDFFRGTPLFERYGGEVEIKALNDIGYDLVELGNHEFDHGAKILAEKLSQAQFSILACNLDCAAVPELAPLVKPSIVKEINGQKIAFIGVITPELEKKVLSLDGIKVKSSGNDWLEPVKEEVAYCQNQGINKIVLVSHCGVEVDKVVAQSIPSIDLIIGGHSHTLLKKPVWVVHDDGTETIIVQTGCYGRYLGKASVVFDQLGHVDKEKTHYHLIPITDQVPADKNLDDYINNKAQPLKGLQTSIVGFADGTFLNSFANMPGDSAIGNLICDAIAQATACRGVCISFHNRGGIRAKLERGPVSEEKLQEILPFGNKIICCTVSGKKLRSLLEYSLGGPYYGGFLDLHGLRLKYNPQNAPGHRIIEALVQDKSDNWRPLIDTANYKIALNDFNFRGGDGYDFTGATEIETTGEPVCRALKDYLLLQKHVKPHYGNRIFPCQN